jgi:hypothetical protein
MACTNLTKGRGLDCNRISGGVKYIYFSVYDEIDSYAYDAVDLSTIDTIDFGGNTIYRYTVPRGSTTVNETITGSTDNGTLFYTPTVNMVLNRLTQQDQQHSLRIILQTLLTMQDLQIKQGHSQQFHNFN